MLMELLREEVMISATIIRGYEVKDDFNYSYNYSIRVGALRYYLCSTGNDLEVPGRQDGSIGALTVQLLKRAEAWSLVLSNSDGNFVDQCSLEITLDERNGVEHLGQLV
jgi:hypothetical protein